jgi:hypothetical protein
MKKIYLVSFITAIVIMSLGFNNVSSTKMQNQFSAKDKHPDVDWSIGCAECHADATPEVFSKWENSRHGKVNFGCYMCHGDGQEQFSAKGNDDSCLGCHSSQEVDFNKSKVKSCFDCHEGHTLKFHN